MDIFELDQFLVPINVSNAHWVCASVNFAKKRIEYFDSLNDSGNRHKAFDVGCPFSSHNCLTPYSTFASICRQSTRRRKVARLTFPTGLITTTP